MKVLVAEDDLVTRTHVEATLQGEGYEVLTVDNGGDALEALCATDGPQLALLDWVMPGMYGPAVCFERRKRPDLDYAYMLLLTVRGQTADIVLGLESGADDFLTKPFDTEELKARLRSGVRILTLENKLRYQATHDPLTELWNLKFLMGVIESQVARSHVNSSSAILLCDLDRFKRINDTQGHEVGSSILCEVAHRLVASVRGHDYVARYGGDEFLVLLPRCNADCAAERAEEIRRAVTDQPFATPRGPVRIGMSVGLFLLNSRTIRPASQILKEVDLALYAAKAAGGMCYRFATPMGIHIPR